MKDVGKAISCGLFLAVLLSTMLPVSFAHADDAGAIAYRKAVMSSVGGHLKAIVTILKGQGGAQSHLVGHAKSLATLAVISQDAFPKGSGPEAGKTEASPRIWEKPVDFQKATDTFVQETARLAAIATSGDMKAFGKQLGVVGKMGCKACHSGFRSK